MGVVDIVLNPDDTHKDTVGLKILIRKQDITSEAYSAAYVSPILFRPYTVECSCERKFAFLVIEKPTHDLTEHIPRRTRFRGVVADISVGEHTMEYGVGIASDRLKSFIRHSHAVDFLWYNLEASGGFRSLAVLVVPCLVIVFDLELLAVTCKHTRLEDNGHSFALY